LVLSTVIFIKIKKKNKKMAKNVINIEFLRKFALDMTDDTPDIAPRQTESTQAKECASVAEDTARRSPVFKVCAWLGAMATLGAWLAMIFNGWTSFALAVGGLLLSAFGARSPRGLVRDMAITAIVAAGVLIVVFGIFFGALLYLDKSLG